MKTAETSNKPIPNGLTDRQRRFAEFVAAGETKIQAFTLAGYRSKGPTANSEASSLLKKPGIQIYLKELREDQRSAALLTRQQKRERLFAIVTGKVPGATVGDMIRAIQVDNLMTGDNQPIKVEGEITLRRVVEEITNGGLPGAEEE